MKMYTKIVIVLTRTFWNCSVCKVLCKKSDSIDRHLELHHSDFLADISDIDAMNVNNNETDGTRTVASGNNTNVTLTKLENQKSNNKLKPVPTGSHTGKNGNKSSRKQPKRDIKQQQVEVISDALDLSGDGGDEDESTYTEATDGCVAKGKKEVSMKSRAPKSGLFRKSASKSRYLTGKRKHLKKIHAAQNNTHEQNLLQLTPVKSEEEVISLASQNLCAAATGEIRVEKKIVKRGRKRRVDLKDMADDKFDPDVKIKPPSSGVQPAIQKSVDMPDKIKQTSLKQLASADVVKQYSCRSSSPRTLSSSALSLKMKRPVDKTRIATCCAPWLFDKHRKAGDKVNKKPRRLLLPEEKDAVRELYGIPAFVQQGNSVSGQKQAYCHGKAPANLSENLQAMCLSNDSSSLREEQTVSNKSLLFNLFTPGSRSFPPDSTHAQENAYAGYTCSGMFSQQFTAQPSDFYSKLPSRGFMNHSFSQTVPSQGTTDTAHQRVDSSAIPVQSSSLGVGNQAHSLHPQSVSHQTNTLSAVQQNISDGKHSVKKTETAVPIAHRIQVTTSKDKINTFDSGKQDFEEKECSVCLEVFDTLALKQKHEQDTGCFVAIECKLCKQRFHGMHQLNLHVFSEHETEKQGFCFACNEGTEGLENLEKHVYMHAFNEECPLPELRFHNCKICKEELRRVYSTVRTHYFRHHIAHLCSECFQNFDDVMVYVEHCRTHEGKVVFCSICGTEFSSVENLKSHFPCAQDVWAEDGRGVQCSKCDLWCPNNAVVEAHRRQHRSQEDVEAYRKGARQGFPCASCEKVFKNRHACQRHMKMVHQGMSCYKHYCEYCGKGFLTKGHMRDHIALHHLGIKRYKCDYCDQQFVCGPTLRRHVRKEHTKYKPYECEHCGQRFFEKTPLQRHLTTHTGLAPFMCEHCGRGFYTKHSFTNHGTTHSTARDFVCTGCQKGFTRKYNLQAHMKICKMA